MTYWVFYLTLDLGLTQSLLGTDVYSPTSTGSSEQVIHILVLKMYLYTQYAVFGSL